MNSQSESMSFADHVKLAIVTSFYLGLAPIIPGTFGTIGGVVLALALVPLGASYLAGLIVLSIVLYLIGRALGDWAERRAAGKDPGFYVLDEVIGYLVGMAWITPPSVLALACGFVLFRVFDIVKPPPARRLENLGGGDGIILDDVIAGLYTLAAMAVLRLTVFEPSAWVWNGWKLGIGGY